MTQKSHETPPIPGAELVLGVAGVALSYREVARLGFGSRRDLFRRPGEDYTQLSGLALKMVCEFRPADFAVTRLINRLDAIEDEFEWDRLLRERTLVYGTFDRARHFLEPMLHALANDPRPAIEEMPRAAEALDRWGTVEAAMKRYEDLGATSTLADHDLDEKTRAEVAVLHKRIAALAGETYVD